MSKTLKEEIMQLASGKIEVKDMSINGKCSKCGECCGSLLPIDQEDLDKIVEYVTANKIKPQKHLMIMQGKLQCPYFNGKKCVIYEARPKICRGYYCYKQKAGDFSGLKGINVKELVPVDMWDVALEIEKEMKE